MLGVPNLGNSFSAISVGTYVVTESIVIPSNIDTIQTTGYYEGGDGGGAYYNRVGSEPATGGLQDASGAWFVLSPYQQICPKMFGAYGDGTHDDTDAFQAAIDFIVPDVSAASGPHSPIYLGVANYLVTQVIPKEGVRFVGVGEGNSHSRTAWPNFGFQSQITQPAGENKSLFLYNSTSTSAVSGVISDISFEKINIRMGWTGPGDAVTISGNAIEFNGVYCTQGCRFDDLEFHNIPGDCIKGDVVPLPGVFGTMWGRYVNGSVLHIVYSAARGTQAFFAGKIQADYCVNEPIVIDASARIAAGLNCFGEVYHISDVKHEIDSSASSTTAYSPNTIRLIDLFGAAVCIENVSALPYNGGGAGTPTTNAIVILSGTKIPYLDVRNCRMGSANAVADYLIDDTVNSVTISKKRRSCLYNYPLIDKVVADNAADIIYSTRQLNNDSGVMDAYDRYQRTADGHEYWGSGAAAVDTELYRSAQALLYSPGGIQAKRLMARGGTALTSAAFALSAGWGAGASVSVDSNSTDQRFRITITAGVGPSANPTATFSYVDAIFTGPQKWVVPPVSVASMGTASTGAIAQITAGTRSINSLVLTYQGTPVDTMTYIIDVVALG